MQNLELNFNVELVAGSTRQAMSEAAATKRDLWTVPIDQLHVIEGFNVRVENDDYHAHIRSLADSMRVEGFYPHKALSGFVAKVNGVNVVYVTDGHCRLKAAKLAIAEGSQIEKLPVIVSPSDTSLEDLTVALVKSNSGKPLSPFETGIVCSRLVKDGWEVKKVSDRLGLSVSYIEDLLSLVGAPLSVRNMVINGQVSAANAVSALRKYGDKASEKLQEALARAQSKGGKKVTAKHMGGGGLKKFYTRQGPVMVDALRGIASSNFFAQMDEGLRTQIMALIGENEEAKKVDTASEIKTNEDAGQDASSEQLPIVDPENGN